MTLVAFKQWPSDTDSVSNGAKSADQFQVQVGTELEPAQQFL